MKNISINLRNARYEDWKCAECCQGDRCNYYVTVSFILLSDRKQFQHIIQLGSSSVRTSWAVVAASLTTVLLLTAAQLA